ncbi:MAG: hypothetical protein KIT22_20190, partial [Verrucomicrobiae bacterium]|nr:hypothetical protein [Verrucomicrobiae bacterium]
MRCLFPTLLTCAAALFSVPVRALDTSMLPPPDPWRYLPLQRTQALLAASNDEHPHPVRILFYGQSITLQRWWLSTADELRRLFPKARLEIANRAISSFKAPLLIKTAEADVYPYHPDLILFHCYGGLDPGPEWEQLLRRFRARTTADVILLGNHVTSDDEIAEPTDPAAISYRSEAWLNYVLSPALVQELGFCFPDNRTAWKAYLKARDLPASALLT